MSRALHRQRQILDWVNIHAKDWVPLEAIAKGIGIEKGQVSWCLRNMVSSGMIQARGNRSARRYMRVGEVQPQVEIQPIRPVSSKNPSSRIEVLKAIRQFAYDEVEFVTLAGVKQRSGRPDRTIYRVLEQLAQAGVLKPKEPFIPGKRAKFEVPVPKLVAEELTQMIEELSQRKETLVAKNSPAAPPAVPKTEKLPVVPSTPASMVQRYVLESKGMFNVYKLARHLKVSLKRKVTGDEVAELLNACPDAVQVGTITWRKRHGLEGKGEVASESPPISENELIKLITPYLLQLRGKINSFTRSQLINVLEGGGLKVAHRVPTIDRLLDWAVQSDILYSSGVDYGALIYQFKALPKVEVQAPTVDKPNGHTFVPSMEQLGKMQDILNKLNSMSLFTSKIFTMEDVFHRVVSLGFKELEKM